MTTPRPVVGEHVFDVASGLVHKIRNVSYSWRTDATWSFHCMDTWIWAAGYTASTEQPQQPLTCLGCIGALEEDQQW